MKFGLYSVYDRQSRQFSAPFTSFTDETATRDFIRAVHDSRGSVDKFPADYELHTIGSFDSDTGSGDVLGNSVLLVKGADHVEG